LQCSLAFFQHPFVVIIVNQFAFVVIV